MLHQNWDDSPSGKNTPSAFFSGRSTEVQLLSNILLYKKSGSILVSAPRGTGKTDLVYKAIEEAKKENKKLLTVVFNANHIRNDSSGADPNLAILKNLIRRTYSECKDIREVSSAISLLYTQAVSKSYEESSSLVVQSGSKESYLKNDTSKTEISVGFNTKFISREIQKLYPYLLISTSVFPIDNTIKLIAAAVILAVGIYSDAYVKKTITGETTKSNSKTDTDINKAKLAFKKDGSIGTLEYGLKDLLTDLEKEGYKVAFIIDELDKLDGDPKQVLTNITSFKGFFNHSDALFIFISDDKVFNYVSEVRKTRDIESTLFNQRVFITKPTPSDVKEYLTKIIYAKPKHGIEDFENYVIYQAQMDFYYIPDVLRDLIVGYDNKKPFINWDEIHIDTGAQRTVNKQKVITTLLEEGNYLYKQASNKYKNDSLIKAAYELANMSGNFKVPVDSIEPDPDLRIVEQFKIDLARYLTFSGIYTQSSVDENGTQMYEFVPTNLAGTPTIDLKTPLEFEQDLINKFNKFNRFIINLYNFKLRLKGEPLKEVVEDQMVTEIFQSTGSEINVYKNIQQIITDELQQLPLKHLKGQEELRKYGEDLENQQAAIVRNHSLTYLKNAFEDIGMPVWTLNDTPNLPQLVPQITSFVNENGVQNIAIKDDGKKQYVIFLLNAGSSLVTNDPALQELHANKNIFIIELFISEASLPKLNEPRIKAFSVELFEITPKNIKDALRGTSFFR